MSVISSIVDTALKSINASSSGGSVAARAGAAVAEAVGNILGNGATFGQITDARVYLAGGSLLGMANKVDGLGLPKPKTEEYSSLGMLSTMKLHTGFEQPEMKITWNSLYKDLAGCLFNPVVIQRFQIRSSQEHYDGSGLVRSLPVVATVHGYVASNSEVTFEQGKPINTESVINVTYSKLTIDGTDLYEFDIINNIMRVGGTDIFSDITGNMGG